MLLWSSPRLHSWYELPDTAQRKALSTPPVHIFGVLQHSRLDILSECVPHLERTFLLRKNKRSDSSALCDCMRGISVHSSLMLLSCACTCARMIQSLE